MRTALDLGMSLYGCGLRGRGIGGKVLKVLKVCVEDCRSFSGFEETDDRGFEHRSRHLKRRN